MTHASAAGSPLEVPTSLVRLSVGLESADDLVADLDAGPRPDLTDARRAARGSEESGLLGPDDPQTRPGHVVVHEDPGPAVDRARPVALQRGLVDRAGYPLFVSNDQCG
jgi:hypothetical protein